MTSRTWKGRRCSEIKTQACRAFWTCYCTLNVFPPLVCFVPCIVSVPGHAWGELKQVSLWCASHLGIYLRMSFSLVLRKCKYFTWFKIYVYRLTHCKSISPWQTFAFAPPLQLTRVLVFPRQQSPWAFKGFSNAVLPWGATLSSFTYQNGRVFLLTPNTAYPPHPTLPNMHTVSQGRGVCCLSVSAESCRFTFWVIFPDVLGLFLFFCFTGCLFAASGIGTFNLLHSRGIHCSD